MHMEMTQAARTKPIHGWRSWGTNLASDPAHDGSTSTALLSAFTTLPSPGNLRPSCARLMNSWKNKACLSVSLAPERAGQVAQEGRDQKIVRFRFRAQRRTVMLSNTLSQASGAEIGISLPALALCVSKSLSKALSVSRIVRSQAGNNSFASSGVAMPTTMGCERRARS